MSYSLVVCGYVAPTCGIKYGDEARLQTQRSASTPRFWSRGNRNAGNSVTMGLRSAKPPDLSVKVRPSLQESEFRKLLEKGTPVRVADRVAGEPVEWLAPATERQFKRATKKSGPLDREHSVLGRVEQSYLRRVLFGEAEQANCSLCGRHLPVELLVAAHVKLRSECTRRERLDADNIVACMCLLGRDVLYERGLVAVGEGRRILTSTIKPCPALSEVFRGLRKRKCNAWSEARAKYFKWHLTQRFQGIATAG